ncbi:hypothetical protein C0J52_05822 [Blattella germanica]|nr:hypothetical protein C0J52_05822 [Blattella germanica]
MKIVRVLSECSPAWEELEADGVNEVGHRETKKECQLRRNTGAGTTTGLEVFLRPSNNETRLIMGQRDLNGARILIHHPSQFPEAGKGLFLPEVIGDVFTVKVSPAVTVTNEAVRNLAPKERNCIFPDERQLTIYHTYTQPGCLTECRINFIVKECGCTPYYFDLNHDQTPECNLSELRCIANHSLDLRFFRPPDGTRGFSEWSSLDCLHCLPTCHETVYNLESSLSQDNNPMLSTSRGYLDVYYKDLGVVKYHRSLMFDKMQLIVSFGGIAGLFLGVSLLSVVELFYYAIKLLIATYYELISLNSKPQQTIKQNSYTSENSTAAPT